MTTEKKKKFITVSLFTFFIWCVTHGFRFVNNLHTCDSLIEVFQDDIAFQRSLGRFMHPSVMILRGTITTPWLIGFLSFVLMALSVFFISEIFQIENNLLLFVLSGIMVCNNTMTSSVAGFLPWMDVYMAALFFAVLAVWLYQKDKLITYIAGSISMIICMGFYQAYIDVAIALFVYVIIKDLAGKNEFKKTMLKVLKTLGGLAASGLVYFAAYKLVCKIHHINVSASYHGLTEIANYSDKSFFRIFIDTYRQFFAFLFNQETFASTILMGTRISSVWEILLTVCLVISILVFLIILVIRNVENKTAFYKIILQILGILILPLSLNFVCFMSKGVEHELMIYSFYLVYVFALCEINEILPKTEKKKYAKFAFVIPFVFFIWNGIVYSNQVYFKIDMEDRAAISIATRIIDDIEDIEGYEPGVTPVRFVGALDHSEYMEPVMYLKEVDVNGNWNTPFTYEMSLPFYLQVYMDVPLNINNDEIPAEVLAAIPAYPKKGSITYVGDTLVVKISD